MPRKPKIDWQDHSSYSRGESGNVAPSTWSAKIGWMHITITRRHGLDGWYGLCHQINLDGDGLSLGADLEVGKTKLLAWIKRHLETGLAALGKAL